MESFNKICDTIYDLTGFTDVNKIERGYSFEKKYILSGSGGRNYLLRVAEISEGFSVAGKKAEFGVIGEIGAYSSLVPKAHYFGVSEDESLCYMVLDYISGRDCEEALVELGSDEQYSLGADAGRELLKLHKLDAPSGTGEWHERISEKFARKCAAYEYLGIKTPIVDMDNISGYVSENDCYMKCRRQSFNHGDYHPANLIFSEGCLAGIIDFNRYEWGDPVHDFMKVAYFTSAVSIPFSVGQIDGYNGVEVSPEFWMKYSLYTAMTVVSDLVWSHWYSHQVGSHEQVELSEERVKRVYHDHDSFESEVPHWYRDYIK